MKRITIFLLISAMLLAALSSCAEKENAASDTEVTVATGETEPETEAILPLDLPNEKYDGYEFKFLTKGDFDVHWKSKDIAAEQITGEALNDAVYTRNDWLMETYGVKVVDIGAQDVAGTAKKSILANSDDYDVICGGIAGATSSLVSSNLLVNLYDVPNLDLSRPYYDQNGVNSLSIDKRLFCVSGDLVTMDNDATWVVLFNKKIVTELNFENTYGSFYDLVLNQKWTHDVFYQTSRDAASDLDGNGKMDENDRWGMESESFNAYAMMAGAGITTFAKDENDIPYFSLYSETAHEVLSKAIEIMRDKSVTLYVSDWTSKYAGATVWSDLMDKTFSDGRSLYNFAGLNRVTLFRSMDTDFGILPVPAYKENQGKYYCPVSLWCANTIAVPICATDLNRTGLIIEAMSWKSKYTLLPAYYDITLKGKASRDEESQEMLDIIFQSTVFDLGNMYDWGGAFSIATTLCETAKSAETFASKVAAAEPKVAAAIDKFISILQEG